MSYLTPVLPLTGVRHTVPPVKATTADCPLPTRKPHNCVLWRRNECTKMEILKQFSLSNSFELEHLFTDIPTAQS